MLRHGQVLDAALGKIFHVYWQVFSKEALEFQDKIVARAGLGDETYLPEGVRPPHQPGVHAGHLARASILFIGVCGSQEI